MKSKKLLWLSSIGLVVVIAVAAVAIGLTRTPADAHGIHGDIQMQIDPMCSSAVPAGMVHCDVLMKHYVNMATGQDVNMEPSNIAPNAAAPVGLTPANLQAAYNLAQASASAGAGQTVAIVDAQDDPNAESDLATYRSQFGLPACTTANGCFKKVGEDGSQNLPTADPNWAVEISLDLDMVSAACPNCNILLVEANQPSFQDLATAEDTAAAMGANAISNSFGGPEDNTFAADFNHPGTIITASSGDSGFAAGPSSPASYSSVVAVGGTTLTQDANTARGWTESAWVDGGAGCSQVVAQPSWQANLNSGCNNRVEVDVSADADPNTGPAIFDSFQQNGWLQVGGTSASSPFVAGVYALAGNTGQLDAAQSLYQNAGQLNDVTTGNDGACAVTVQCTAGPGWDGPTGEGTPNGTGAF